MPDMRRTLFSITVLSITAALACSTAADAAPCITAAQVRAGATYVAPVALDAFGKRCGMLIPDDPWLKRDLPQLSARYRREGGGDIRAVLPLIEQMTGQSLSAFGDDAAKQNAVDTLVAGAIVGKLTPASCAQAVSLLEPLGPLPLVNVANFFVAAMRLAAKDKDMADADIKLCPEPAGVR